MTFEDDINNLDTEDIVGYHLPDIQEESKTFTNSRSENTS